MLLYICHILQSRLCFFLEQLTEQILNIVAPVFVEVRLGIFDFVEEFAPVFGVEGRETMDELINE